MRTKIAAIVLTAGLTAVGGAALVVPGSAFAASPSASPSATSSSAPTSSSAADRAAARVTAIKNALKGLVTDNTLTQAQADKVASTLSTSDALRGGRGFGGRGHLSHETVAGILGLSTDELRTQEQAGKTLTQIAATKSISKATLIDKLVADTKTQLAADVKSGEITQAQSDAATSTLTADVTKRVDEVHPGRGGRGEHGGRDGHGDHGNRGGSDDADQAPTA